MNVHVRTHRLPTDRLVAYPSKKGPLQGWIKTAFLAAPPAPAGSSAGEPGNKQAFKTRLDPAYLLPVAKHLQGRWGLGA